MMYDWEVYCEGCGANYTPKAEEEPSTCYACGSDNLDVKRLSTHVGEDRGGTMTRPRAPPNRNIYADREDTLSSGTNMPITKRDRVWAAALHLRAETESDYGENYSDNYGVPGFSVQDISEYVSEAVAERTIRDCLNAMCELGELSKRPSNPSRYRLPRGYHSDNGAIGDSDE